MIAFFYWYQLLSKQEPVLDIHWLCALAVGIYNKSSWLLLYVVILMAFETDVATHVVSSVDNVFASVVAVNIGVAAGIFVDADADEGQTFLTAIDAAIAIVVDFAVEVAPVVFVVMTNIVVSFLGLDVLV